VNVDGQWRPEGRGGRWRSVDEDPAAAAAADAASHAVCSWCPSCLLGHQRANALRWRCQSAYSSPSTEKQLHVSAGRLAMHSVVTATRGFRLCHAQATPPDKHWRRARNLPARVILQAHANGSVAVKPDPEAAGNGHVGPAGPTELSSGSSDGGESESESAELRRAAAAYAATTTRCCDKLITP